MRCGGGSNHRMGLWDAALVKDNHVVAAGGVAAAFEAVRAQFPGRPGRGGGGLAGPARRGGRCRRRSGAAGQLHARRDRGGGRPGRRPLQLESSGGLTLEVAADYARTGVDFLAVGALTHSAPVLDLGADLRPQEE